MIDEVAAGFRASLNQCYSLWRCRFPGLQLQKRDGVPRRRSPKDAAVDEQSTDYPSQFFYFLSPNELAALVESTGLLASPPPLPASPDWVEVLEARRVLISPWLVQALHDPVHRRVELAAERHRLLSAPQAPSRLSCLFAFDDHEAVELVAETEGWDLSEVRVFRPEHIERAARVDMTFVTMAYLAAKEGLSPVDDEAFWDGYWTGREHPPSTLVDCGDPACTQPVTEAKPAAEEPIWEWLVEGSLRLERGIAFQPRPR